MDNQQHESLDNDILFFADESGPDQVQQDPEKNFKLLIVDDENEIHVMTKLVLDDYQYMGRGLEFISAYSGKEARQILKTDNNIACCLLDVVMETKEAGLEVARFIREEINNSKIRIILRTGQPGKAPEKEVILNYDINDYKEKTELTTQKLFTTITTALRSFIHLVELEQKNNEIQAKNIRLNEEIARRIVAESNLTKYNRSLERMIENKTQRLKETLSSLDATEKQLFITQKAAIVSDLSAISMDTLDASNTMIDSNLKKMNLYRQQMTVLLEKYPQIIEDSFNGVQQISQSINDVRMFVSINDEEWTSTDLNQILKNVSGFTSFGDKKIDIQFDLQELPITNLPAKNIEKSIHAVLENAMAAVNTHGIISISSRHEEPQIVLCISDTGIGICKNDIDQVFTPYFTGWPDGGKGLGLSFAKSVFLSCGGDIRLTSTAGEGTTVTLCLPVGNQDRK